jgi:hypothetical protein
LAHKAREEAAKRQKLERKHARQKLEYLSSLRYGGTFRNDPVYIYAQAKASFDYANNPYVDGVELMANAVEALRELRVAGDSESSRLLTQLELDARDFLVPQLTQKLDKVRAGHISTGEALYIHNLNAGYLKDKRVKQQIRDLKIALNDAALQYYGSRTHVTAPKMGGSDEVSIAMHRMYAPDRRALRACYVYDLVRAGSYKYILRDRHPEFAEAILYNRLHNLYDDGQKKAGYKSHEMNRQRLPRECQAILDDADDWYAENYRLAA